MSKLSRECFTTSWSATSTNSHLSAACLSNCSHRCIMQGPISTHMMWAFLSSLVITTSQWRRAASETAPKNESIECQSLICPEAGAARVKSGRGGSLGHGAAAALGAAEAPGRSNDIQSLHCEPWARQCSTGLAHGAYLHDQGSLCTSTPSLAPARAASSPRMEAGWSKLRQYL